MARNFGLRRKSRRKSMKPFDYPELDDGAIFAWAIMAIVVLIIIGGLLLR